MKFGQHLTKFLIQQNYGKLKLTICEFCQKSAKIATIFNEKIEIRERCKGVHCVDLGSFPTNIYYLLANICFDIAENELSEVCRSKQAIPTSGYKSGPADKESLACGWRSNSSPCPCGTSSPGPERKYILSLRECICELKADLLPMKWAFLRL